MNTHELKCQQPWFQGIWSGHKTFEIRRDDRGFQPGDVLRLRECWIDEDGDVMYSGREANRTVTYVLRDGEHVGLREGYVALGLDQAGVVAGS